MHEANIEVLRNEAQRLLELEITLLEEMLRADGVVSNATTESKQTFDRESVPKYLEVLRGEHTKLTNMELVIAVVGTMKAGKSTTINAIVGTEVLPNRNRPMTALPTLIRHTKGQVEPILIFDNNDPINQLFNTIHTRIKQGRIDNTILSRLAEDKDMTELVGNIQSQQVFGRRYVGAEGIFRCLKTLNDLVRLCDRVKVPFPFAEYRNIEQLPVIAVEFVHLREADDAKGQLTLLDTPGPNEAGQQHLREMLTDQLKKTSAVLAVFDYTQLKSDADEGVRNELQAIAETHKGRLFALVNKFDQKNQHSDGEKEVKELVANQLMNGLIEKDHVFPVSSLRGYLANRAKHEITINKLLPHPDKEPWVTDFANQAFGASWENEDIEDSDSVIKQASKLWKKSGFEKPLKEVICVAHGQAALYSLNSAAKKINNCSADVDKFLEIQNKSLVTDISVLKNLIASLQAEIEQVSEMKHKQEKNIEDEFLSLKKNIESTLEISTRSAIEELSKIFEIEQEFESKKLQFENTQNVKLAEKRRSKTLKGMLEKLFNNGRILSYNQPKVDGSKGLIIFKEEQDAKKLVNEMLKSVGDSLLACRKSLEKPLEHSVANFKATFKQVQDESEQIISKINDEMNCQGFKVVIQTPNVSIIGQYLNADDLSLSGKIKTETKYETYRVKQDSWWGSFKRLLNDDWGYEERTRSVESYTLKLSELKDYVEQDFKGKVQQYEQELDKELFESVKTQMKAFFMQLERTVENVRGDLQAGLNNNSTTQEQKQRLIETLTKFQSEVPSLQKDAHDLEEDLSSIS